MKKFPEGKYGRQTLRFFPAPYKAPLRSFAALVFPWQEESVLICDIDDRGWSIPSGRVEPDETSAEAVHREALEEAGAIISNLQYIGCYQITERGETRWADVFAAHVFDLVDIPQGTESRGRKLVTFDELPDTYHLWNELTQLVFEHSRSVMRRLESVQS